MLKSLPKVLGAVLFLLAASNGAYGSVVFTSFGPGGFYTPASGASVFGPSVEASAGYDTGSAGSFVSNADYSLDSITLPLFYYPQFSDSVNSFTVSINADNDGVPGPPLETWSPISTGGSLLNLTSLGHPAISTGQTYWIVALSADSYSEGAWLWGIPGTFDLTLDRGTSWNTYWNGTPAFEIDGAAVPEPATACILLFGTSALLYSRHAKPRAN